MVKRIKSRWRARLPVCIARYLLVFSLCFGGSLWAGNWPQWRGPAGDSVSNETGLPLKWSEEANIAWKCPLPGEGASTPAIWGDAIFVTTQQADRLLLLRINKATGQIAWERQVGSGET